VSRLHVLLDRPGLLRRTALASVIANVGIVITGGVVRLTGSGMGCPTWPRCDGSSMVPTRELGYHGQIEFGNRTLISVVGGLAVACLLLALVQLPRRRDRLTWSGLVVAGVAAQGVLGGATVHTVLNPWIVSTHFLLSIAVIAAAYRFWVLTREPAATGPAVGPRVRALSWTLVGVTAVVLAVGTVVTGSGPHAGDANARRTGLDPGGVAQLHADLVMLLIGLSVALLLLAPATLRRAAAILVGVELAQGAIGFVQYFTHLPVLVVALHMAGACAVWLAALGVLSASATARRSTPPAGSARPARTADTATARSAPAR
jgi:cytochrome c oxidase assembly protein subunit 15